MDYIVPVYYTEAGRGITRYHAIPYQVDALKPVHRRILLGVYETARKKFTKSAKVVGHVIGNYHFHGDKAVYDTLVGLVQQGFVEGQGNWGSPGIIEDNPPAAYRYTECKLAKWVDELAFKYIDFVPWLAWETHAIEPLYLPSPVPVGLIGNGLIEGIAFHTTLIPKFKLETLIKRLHYLLEFDATKSYEYDIKFNCEEGCKVLGADTESILTNGSGTIIVGPEVVINNDKCSFDVLGKPYKKTYKPLLKYIEDNKLNITVKDLCDKKFRMRLIATKKMITTNYNGDINNLINFLANKFFIKRHNIKCLVCDDNGKVHQKGIDNLILLSYNCWKKAIERSIRTEIEKVTQQIFESYVVSFVRYILHKHNNVKTIDEILSLYNSQYKNIAYCELQDCTNNTIKKYITATDIINVCNKLPIKRLVEFELKIETLKETQDKLFGKLADLDNYAFNESEQYLK